MAKYLIKASGCDDSTSVIVDLTDAEFAVAERIAKAVTQASFFGCMPRLAVSAASPDVVAQVEQDNRDREAEEG